MTLTPAQKTLLKTDILANFPASTDAEIAAAYNLTATPDFWVWRSSVSRAQIYHETSDTATTWNWTTYKAQNATEQNAWVQMFMGDVADFSKANFRAGIAAIFGAGNAQTTHCLAVGRRKARRAEKVLATGTGSTAVPATMGFEGDLTVQNVIEALSS